MNKRVVVGIAAGLLMLVGCAPGPEMLTQPTQALVPSTATPVPTVTAESSPTAALPDPAQVLATRESTQASDRAQVMVGLVIADLAERLDIDADEIDVDQVEDVDWPGLACAVEESPPVAEPVPGYRIVLLYQAQPYVYHTDDEAAFVACAEEDVVAVTGEPVILDTNMNALIDVAQQNLAARLDLPVRRVFLVEAFPVLWDDASLGCVLSDETLPATPVAGYRIVLRAGSDLYYYHTNYRQVVLCPAEAVRLPAALQTPEATPTQE